MRARPGIMGCRHAPLRGGNVTSPNTITASFPAAAPAEEHSS
jgi:hypothetical protein